MPSFYVQNFGCRATQADGAAIEHQFEQRGLARATTAAHSDLVILNTCTVTESADQDARAAIRRIQRQNPGAKIIVTGCYAQRAPQETAALPGVTAVIGNSHKHQLADLALKTSTQDAEPTSALQSQGSDGFWVAQRFSAAKHASTPDGASATGATAFIPLAALTQTLRTENRELRSANRIFVSDIFAHTELLAAPVFEGTGASNDRTRPNLKVQDGCDNRCSFCVIPYVRGQSRSLPLREILHEVNALVEAGYKEVVISGINLGRWGRDLAPAVAERSAFGWRSAFSAAMSVAKSERASASEVTKKHFPAACETPLQVFPGLKPSQRPTTNDQRLELLIRAILNETPLEKLRISSVEPMDWTDDLISLIARSPRIARHAHVPLQSGSDAVLRRMHRKYRPWHYREKIEKIRAAMPTAAIGADVMVGFPGETAAEFEQTRRLIEDLPLTYLHVFTYSARPGTPAAALPNQVPVHVARERNKILRDLAEEKKQAFMRSFIGKTIEAITLGGRCHSEPFAAARERGENERGISVSAFTEALTDSYLKLRLKGRHQPNRWLRARIQEVTDDVLAGIVD